MVIGDVQNCYYFLEIVDNFDESIRMLYDDQLVIDHEYQIAKLKELEIRCLLYHTTICTDCLLPMV